MSLFGVQAFMAVIPHDQINFIVDVLQEYDSVTQYLIGLETSLVSHQDNSGQHMHFLVTMSDTHYKNFADRIFRKKYNLRGQAKKGLPRQYGKLREIHDLERMAAYTVKDGNIRTNMLQKDIERWAKVSFKKDEEKQFRENLYEYLDAIQPPETIASDTALGYMKVNENNIKPPLWLRLQILGYIRTKQFYKIANPNTIRNFVTGYLMSRAEYTLEDIDIWLFGTR